MVVLNSVAVTSSILLGLKVSGIIKCEQEQRWKLLDTTCWQSFMIVLSNGYVISCSRGAVSAAFHALVNIWFLVVNTDAFGKSFRRSSRKLKLLQKDYIALNRCV